MSENHPGAGTPAPPRDLINVPRLIAAYYTEEPDCSVPEHRVSFGTSGHRGSALAHSFNEPHILAISQAVCEYRAREGTTGPLFVGMDTHALSEPAFRTALEVFAANGVTVMIDARDGFTPTPAVSHAIVAYNRGRTAGPADGVVITPSHNPPEDGGYKYNPPSGGPADTGTTRVIEARANELLASGVDAVGRIPFERALRADTTQRHDFIAEYVEGIGSAVDLDAVRSAGIKLGADPMGGSGAAYWEPLAERYGLDLTVTNEDLDPRFAFMPRDRDGVIRMDCSSPFAMARLIDLKDRFDVAFGNDTDFDRHGIVTRTTGLVAPNPYLAVAVDYLFRNREGWPAEAAIGKTLVSSGMIDRVAKRIGRPVVEVPVGFKWFVDGLLTGALGFGGEESAGASFLDREGRAWSTDKDGILLDLLAAEITARTGRDPGEAYREMTRELGEPVYARISAPADRAQKAALKNLSPENLAGVGELAGESIEQVLTAAPGNGAAIGGLKVTTENGWFAARPSGTEDIYKIYAESFLGDDHLARILEEARSIVTKALA